MTNDEIEKLKNRRKEISKTLSKESKKNYTDKKNYFLKEVRKNIFSGDGRFNKNNWLDYALFFVKKCGMANVTQTVGETNETKKFSDWFFESRIKKDTE